MKDKRKNIHIEPYIKINQNIGKQFNLNITETAILCYIAFLYQKYQKDILFINADFIIQKLPLLNITSQDTVNKILTNLANITKSFERGIDDIDAVAFIKKHFQVTHNRTEHLFLYKYCSWCNVEVLTFDKHHYPIRRRDNGKEVINICKNCHQLFHDITDNHRVIKVIDKNFFNNIKL